MTWVYMCMLALCGAVCDHLWSLSRERIATYDVGLKTLHRAPPGTRESVFSLCRLWYRQASWRLATADLGQGRAPTRQSDGADSETLQHAETRHCDHRRSSDKSTVPKACRKGGRRRQRQAKGCNVIRCSLFSWHFERARNLFAA